uniref:Secreted protein n=1 Tax=Globodera pallida TaxID=36090 RepID=A0A183BIE5_GLOPA
MWFAVNTATMASNRFRRSLTAKIRWRSSGSDRHGPICHPFCVHSAGHHFIFMLWSCVFCLSYEKGPNQEK